MAGLFGSAATAAANNSNTQGDLSKDVAVTSPPDDSISQIRFSSQSEHLAVASWDKKVRIYEIDGQGQSHGRAAFDCEGPVLSVAWSNDGSKVVGGGADKYARMMDLQTQQTQPVALHDQPIKCVEMFDYQGSPMLVTASWDKMVKYWDLRQQNPVASVTLKDRAYSMSLRNNKMLVVGTAERYCEVIDLQRPDTIYKSIQSPLKWQTRVVSCFTDATGFAVGSIEGRCGIQYVEQKDHDNNFSFKCHRQGGAGAVKDTQVYSVNDISFHPVNGTFSTAGSDGTFHFWDKDAKHRLKGYPEVGSPITSTDFNRTGTIFAYACSYDWSKGFASHQPGSPNKIMLHPVQGDETKPKPRRAR